MTPQVAIQDLPLHDARVLGRLQVQLRKRRIDVTTVWEDQCVLRNHPPLPTPYTSLTYVYGLPSAVDGARARESAHDADPLNIGSRDHGTRGRTER